MKKKSKIPANPRQTALQITMACLYDRQELQAALNMALEQDNWQEKDKKLITELVYGYCRYKGRIDFLLGLFLKKPDSLPPELFTLLGLAAYEILFLRIPHHASVHQAVQLTRQTAGQKFTRLANAVLRRVCELPVRGEQKDLYCKDNPEESVFFSRFYSCPLWIVQHLKQNFSCEQTKTLLFAFLQQPPTGVRINPKRTGSQYAEIETQHLLQAEKQGLISRQSLAAQEAITRLNPHDWPQPVWDACAGRGGKSLLLAEQGLRVLASDMNTKRILGLKAEQTRLEIDFPVFIADAASSCFKIAPPTILLDAPCSGLGVLSRRPDSKWKRQEKDLAALQKIQTRLLTKTADSLPPGGNLIYITCTLGKEENDNQIKKLLEQKKSLRLAETYQTPVNSTWYEFFYAARLQRG